MKTHHFIFLSLGFLTSSLVVANDEMLNRPVTLQSESILIDVLSVTLQHAIITSSAYQGSNPSLKRLAKQEISKRQQDLQRLHQLSKTQVPTLKSSTNLNNNDLNYQKSMLQNHARLIELAEFGSSLKLSNPIRRYLRSLSGDVTSELSILNNF
ncbi:hypothetical protein K4H28_01615 [Deefgea tanakiae]|uniref:DUF4142 domain-containing protein n=1 Tax=Deefgea tanakiae TaxID=2865840 RepID=A0ABX8Z8P8_9NEIS|nr:hypothetical protein [Deefgea tanakiae]QZA78155.1 hypothetical protein K4H28_01615 [Deefgea tanakiae]